MRPWYRKSYRYDNSPEPTFITPFSKLWGYSAPVTKWLIGINFAIWLIMIFSDGLHIFPLQNKPGEFEAYLDGKFSEGWFSLFAMTPELVMKGRVWQFLTSVFLHDPDNALHIIFNMYLLWMFGPRVERTFSSRQFLWFFIATGIGGNILSFLMRMILHQMMIPSLGASAAVFGILVAYAFLFSNELVYLFFFVPMKVWTTVVIFIVLEALFILLRLVEQVDHWGHLGGALTAAIWMLILIKVKGHKTIHGWIPGGGFHSWRLVLLNHTPGNPSNSG